MKKGAGSAVSCTLLISCCCGLRGRNIKKQQIKTESKKRASSTAVKNAKRKEKTSNSNKVNDNTTTNIQEDHRAPAAERTQRRWAERQRKTANQHHTQAGAPARAR
uniref:Putative secreted protein n=1 Tax=Anopheles darlingi TaxID=43151 RepID=A0A2M4D765_ANODA